MSGAKTTTETMLTNCTSSRLATEKRIHNAALQHLRMWKMWRTWKMLKGYACVYRRWSKKCSVYRRSPACGQQSVTKLVKQASVQSAKRLTKQ